MAENIYQFHELNRLPVQIHVDISRLNSGNGIEVTFLEQKAKWHKSCSLKFSSSKLECVKNWKRKSDGFDDGATTSKKIFFRSSTGEAETYMPVENTNR